MKTMKCLFKKGGQKFILLALFYIVAGNASAVELVCSGQAPVLQKRKPFFINCSNKVTVINILSAAEKESIEQGVGGKFVDACRASVDSLKGLANLPDPKEITQKILKPCNIALQEIK